jgi:chemotaxis protein methyltransferase CheR
VKDLDGVAFLQWALPRLGMRWPGFRKVRRQVCRRVTRRREVLRLSGLDAYRDYLEEHPEEWVTLDTMCRITISRFYRDRGIFDRLRDGVIPRLAAEAAGRGESELRFWSAGCASGEEAYSLRILWDLVIAPRHPSLRLHVLATDADERMLGRARTAVFSASSLRELPPAWRDAAFAPAGDAWSLKEPFRTVEFRTQDVRRAAPDETFDLIACRNLVFTYYDVESQRDIVATLAQRSTARGVLVLGRHEKLPEGVTGFEPWPGARGVSRRSTAAAASEPGADARADRRR